MGVGKGGEQGGDQYQPAAAHDGVDKTGKQRGHRDNQQFHDCIVNPIEKGTGVAGALSLFLV